MGGEIRLKYVDELIKEEIRFAVPDYQRGYKWTTENINELLTDIITLKDGEEYCLMPIIVRPTKDKEGKDIIEIVDGQQRLTTLQLIISHIFNDDSKCIYSIPNECYNNLDKINVENASTAIDTFGKKDELQAKLLPDGKHSPFYFIWYVINGSPIDAVNTFNRVNSWKIPLKESELAKAHILSAFGTDGYAERRLANIKWVNLEKLFNGNDFFSFFIIDKDKEQVREYESAHMDLLLEILATVRLELTPDKREGYRYPIYKAIVKKNWDGAKLLAELERIANVMKFIYEDRVSYHLASYLLLKQKRKPVPEIVRLYINNESYPGAKALLDEIKQEPFLTTADRKTIVSMEYVEELNYWETKDKKELNDILTLYNICDALKNNAYYDFYPTVMHKKQEWTLEHIHAKNEGAKDEKEIDSIIRQLSLEDDTWLKNEKKRYKEDALKGLDLFYDERLYPLLGGVPIDALKSESNKIDFSWYETSIKNLALLPKNENSAFNNRNYLEKIEKLKSFDLSSYIPACTLQCFSKKWNSESDVLNEVWTEKEGKKYLATIASIITESLNNLDDSELKMIDFESKALKITNHTDQVIAEKKAEGSSDTISNKAYCLRKLSNILIPDFQRAYAQGRNTPQSREIIENFITDIRKALLCSNSPLSLDFIYGRKNTGAFEPYDGQQRLTTLFLVHLYILRKADCEQSRNKEWKGFKLSYRTSIEAGRFVEAISDNNNQIFFKQNDTWKLCHLESQLYIDSPMLEDDAVKTMLRTLSVIDEKLGDIKAVEAVKALDNITFSLYENLPDDNPEVFYLRTNTRGLPLTPFENFRSKYEAYLKYKNKADDSLVVTRNRMNNYFNFFYSQKDKKSPDEKLMNLFVSYFSSLYSLYGLQEDDTERSKEFIPFQYFANIFDVKNMEMETVMMPLLNLLDFLAEGEDKIKMLTNDDDGCWYSGKIKEAILNNKYNNKSDYLLVITFFFRVFNKNSFDGEKYKAYIRVVTNLINNNVSINKDNRELWKAISKSDFSEESLLQILNNLNNNNPTIAEEVKKLRLIQADSTWRSLIENAESTAFADGFIDYLFDSDNSKEEFEQRLKTFKKYFDKEGVQKNFRTLLQTAYITMLPDGCNLYEVEFFNSKRTNWRDRIFAHPEIYKDCISNILDENLCIEVNNDDANIYELKRWILNPSNEWFIGVMTEDKADEPPFIFRWSYGYPGFKQKNKRQYLLCDLYEKRYTELIRELEKKNTDFKLDGIFKFKNPNNDKEFVVKPQDSWYDILFSYKEKCYGFSVWGELIKYQQNWNQPTEMVKEFPIFKNGHPDSCKTAEQVIAELDKLNNQN